MSPLSDSRGVALRWLWRAPGESLVSQRVVNGPSSSLECRLETRMLICTSADITASGRNWEAGLASKLEVLRRSSRMRLILGAVLPVSPGQDDFHSRGATRRLRRRALVHGDLEVTGTAGDHNQFARTALGIAVRAEANLTAPQADFELVELGGREVGDRVPGLRNRSGKPKSH